MMFAGESGAKLMQGWIQEEYATMMHKRGRGLPDEVQKIGQELQIPQFNGENLEDWIYQLEDFFHFFRLKEEKIKVGIMSLDGEALQWVEWENVRQPFFEWLELKNMVLQLYGSAPVFTGKVKSQNIFLAREYGGLSGFAGGRTKGGKPGGPYIGSAEVPEENQGDTRQRVAPEKNMGAHANEKTREILAKGGARGDDPSDGPRRMAGNLMMGGGATTCGGLNREEKRFVKGGGVLGSNTDYFREDEGGLMQGTFGRRFERGAAGFNQIVGGKSDERNIGDFKGSGSRGDSSHHGGSLNDPKGGLFEKGGAGCSGSGGGPGDVAGSGSAERAYREDGSKNMRRGDQTRSGSAERADREDGSKNGGGRIFRKMDWLAREANIRRF